MRKLALVLLLGVTGCTSGLGQLQTAPTLLHGEKSSTLSAGYAWNAQVEERKNGAGNVVLQYAARFGVAPHVDIGVRTFFGVGLLADAKVQVVDRPRLAVSLLGGLGGALDLVSNARVIHVPALALVSYRVASFFTPYVAAGYGAFWILGYQTETHVPSGSTSVPHDWHGDGLLMLHAGFELGRPGHTRLMLEYGYLRPTVEDPGDHFEFAANHLFLGGVRF